MRRVLVSFLAVLLTVGYAVPVPAQSATGSVLLIMDASGSMNRVDDSGTPLIDGAKGALREIVHRLPPDANVGLRVYGHRATNEDPVVGCVDTELVVPVGPIDRDALGAAIDSFDASGFTPIGLSLQKAAEDLPATGARTIILVSDGVDTCAPPDPCEVAEDLAVEGFVTQIHTVGLFLDDPAAIGQLQCIADAGGGTFSRVDSIDNFFEQLSGLVNEALEGPGRISPRVQGALAQDLAPVLSWEYNPDWPALHTDAVGTIETGETRWFAFDADDDRVPFGHLYVTAQIDWQPEAGPEEYLEVQLFDEAGAEVGVPHEVMGVVVEAPQRLYLAESAKFTVPDSFPGASAVTGPRGAFPAWEFEPWFALTRQRFYGEAMNGGVYELWKFAGHDPLLAPGRYYAAVTWSSEREATSELHMFTTLYPTRSVEERWIRDVPQSSVFNEDGRDADRPTQLVMVEWDGVLLTSSAVPLRSIEVVSTLEVDEPRFLRSHLNEGEGLFVGSTVVFARAYGGAGVRIELTHEDGWLAPEVDPDEFGAGEVDGYVENIVFLAPVSGQYTLSVEVDEHNQDEPAILMALFVFPPVDRVGGEPQPAAESNGLPAGITSALLSGLRAVRETVGESG